MAQVRTRKRGKTYSYIFEAGQVNGRRKVVEKGGFATKDAAYEAGVAAYADWKHGNIGLTSDKITLNDFMQHYLESVVRLNVRPTTYDVYTRVISHHIAPQIGSLYLQDITPAIIDRFIRQHAQSGFSRSYLLQIKRILHQSLDYAVYPAELLISNPTNYIKIPKNAPTNIIKRSIITPEQYKSLLKKAPYGSRCHIPIVLLYHTGMRIGEVLGLCWEDVVFSKRPSIKVSRQYSYLSNVGNLFNPPKTQSSEREILIDDKLVALLKRWKKTCHENELARGDSYIIVDEAEDHTLKFYSKALITPNTNRRNMICIAETGRPLSRATLMHLLAAEGLNAHSFRHTHATILAEEGAPMKGIAGRLGHKRIDITDEIYTHSTVKMQENVADIFANKMQTK